MILETIIIGSSVLAAFISDSAEKKGRSFRFSHLTCPSATSDLVDWSSDNWWYPTPVEEIEWDEFRDSVDLKPEDVEASGYLPWREDWEPFEEFIGRPEASYSEAFYRGYLPSGTPFYVWVGSGIEHWWTPGGESIDVQSEQEILSFLEDKLEHVEDEVELADVLQLVLIVKPAEDS